MLALPLVERHGQLAGERGGVRGPVTHHCHGHLGHAGNRLLGQFRDPSQDPVQIGVADVGWVGTPGAAAYPRVAVANNSPEPGVNQRLPGTQRHST